MVSAPADVLLQADGLVRRYGDRTVVAVQELALRRGEILAVVGPNGAGKSTLFRMLLLLERPDAGEIRVGGEPVRGREARARQRLAGVFQRPILFSGSVADNVAYGLRVRGVAEPERRQRALAALNALGLERCAAASVHTLSGGEAQRVALARALALRPDVLLLDEPTANLDITIRRRLRHDLERVGREHAAAILLITHDAAEAFGLADRVAVMHHGRIVQSGTPEEIMLRPGSPFVAELTGAELLLHGMVEQSDDGLVAVRVAPDVLLWAATAPDQALAVGARAVVGYRPEDVVLAPATAATETSAVNRLPVRVESIVPAGAFVRVLLHEERNPDVRLTALLTRRSVDALALRPGTPAGAYMKAAALHAWQTDEQ